MIADSIKLLRSKVLSEELAIGSLLFFSTKIFGIFLTYLFTWWITSNYGAGKWGIFALCFITLNILTTISLFGTENFIIKHIAIQNFAKNFSQLLEIYKKILVIVVGVSLIMATLLFLFPTLFCRAFFDGKQLQPWLKLVAVILPIYAIYQINNSVISGMKRMSFYGLFKNILPFLFTILLYSFLHPFIYKEYFIRFEESKILILLTFGIAIVIGLLLNSLFLLKNIKIDFKKKNQQYSIFFNNSGINANVCYNLFNDLSFYN